MVYENYLRYYLHKYLQYTNVQSTSEYNIVLADGLDGRQLPSTKALEFVADEVSEEQSSARPANDQGFIVALSRCYPDKKAYQAYQAYHAQDSLATNQGPKLSENRLEFCMLRML